MSSSACEEGAGQDEQEPRLVRAQCENCGVWRGLSPEQARDFNICENHYRFSTGCDTPLAENDLSAETPDDGMSVYISERGCSACSATNDPQYRTSQCLNHFPTSECATPFTRARDFNSCVPLLFTRIFLAGCAPHVNHVLMQCERCHSSVSNACLKQLVSGKMANVVGSPPGRTVFISRQLIEQIHSFDALPTWQSTKLPGDLCDLCSARLPNEWLFNPPVTGTCPPREDFVASLLRGKDTVDKWFYKRCWDVCQKLIEGYDSYVNSKLKKGEWLDAPAGSLVPIMEHQIDVVTTHYLTGALRRQRVLVRVYEATPHDYEEMAQLLPFMKGTSVSREASIRVVPPISPPPGCDMVVDVIVTPVDPGVGASCACGHLQGENRPPCNCKAAFAVKILDGLSEVLPDDLLEAEKLARKIATECNKQQHAHDHCGPPSGTRKMAVYGFYMDTRRVGGSGGETNTRNIGPS